MTARATTVAVLALAFSSACYEDEPVASADIATADMQLYVTADGDDDATRMTIDVSGPGGRVELGGGDALLAGPSGSGLRMLERDALIYEGIFGAGATLVDVELRRQEPYEGTNFAVALPARAELVLPPKASRSQPLRIEWQPAAGTYLSVIEIVGDCFTTVLQDSPVDPGFYLVKPEALEPSSGTCVVTVTLKRSTSMQVPAPNLGRVDALVSQSMTATFESVP